MGVGGGDSPVINLKKLNIFIPYEKCKIDLDRLKLPLEKNDLLCEIDHIDDAYFAIPLSKKSSKYVRFKWSGNLYEFLCLCFGLRPAPELFPKLLKIPIIRVLAYLDDMLLM